MMKPLLDENISWVVAEQITAKNQAIQAQSVHRWRGSAFVGQADGRLLRIALEEGLTLVTYDLRTIPLLLREMASDGEDHAGVLFIDDASIRNSNFGGLVAAILAHWQRFGSDDWTNRVAFLEPARV